MLEAKAPEGRRKPRFSKLQLYPNSDHTITVYVIKKRTFEDPNSRPGETDSYVKKNCDWKMTILSIISGHKSATIYFVHDLFHILLNLHLAQFN